MLRRAVDSRAGTVETGFPDRPKSSETQQSLEMGLGLKWWNLISTIVVSEACRPLRPQRAALVAYS